MIHFGSEVGEGGRVCASLQRIEHGECFSLGVAYETKGTQRNLERTAILCLSQCFCPANNRLDLIGWAAVDEQIVGRASCEVHGMIRLTCNEYWRNGPRLSLKDSLTHAK